VALLTCGTLTVMITNVYIDAFNLYFGTLQNTPYKWLDIRALICRLYPNDTINEVKIFTANVNNTPSDPTQSLRQQIYFRALATTGVAVHLGLFTTHDKWQPLVNSFPTASIPTWTIGTIPKPGRTDAVIGIMPDGTQCARVKVTNEKGTDVTLGAHLLIDAFEKKFEQAIVVSNDSDLAIPVQYVNSSIGLPVQILHPSRTASPAPVRRKDPGVTIRGVASGAKNICSLDLAACQLPSTLTDAIGTITKPPTW